MNKSDNREDQRLAQQFNRLIRRITIGSFIALVVLVIIAAVRIYFR